MAKNLEARRWGARLLREVVEYGRQKCRYDKNLARMAYVGAGQVDTVARLAANLGYRLVIQPPEERGSGRWYAMGGKWKDQLKHMVFHWWNREDEELIATGQEKQLDRIFRTSNLRQELREAGINADIFTDWLQTGKTPTMETFCILAMFEGYGIEWREIPK